ncbi:blue copper protein 1a-like [Humulus lupulus]|uniref:blue copper protein 1a-like n=1 Tax=Humulus lupulus TaxID=3486 RepID=UPI002B41070F|nr:blue copper protein 1a-like [Humulus lupulus]
MASSPNKFLLILAIATILLPSIAVATEYVVGGDAIGWKPNFNYTDWAKDKMFMVGDTLVFKYDPTKHDVYKVNGTAFSECVTPPGAEVLKSGNDIVTLKSAGNKWYLCSTLGHCANGQKLKITVMDMMSAPQPSPNAAPPNVFVGFFQIFVSLAIVILLSSYAT